MSNDLVQGVLTDGQLQEVLELIAQIRTKLPFLINLSNDERVGLPKLGDKSRGFVEQGLILATQNPDILPRSFDIDEYRQDAILFKQMETIRAALQQLYDLADDTVFGVASDAYSSTLVVYGAATWWVRMALWMRIWIT